MAAALGLLATGVYLVGSSRSFENDEAITFANFVVTRSTWAVLGGRTDIEHTYRSVTGTSDHVLVSVLSHLVYLATGTHSEFAYRILPALAAGAAIAVLCFFLAQRFGLLAGIVPTIFMATTQAWVYESRQMRGYSFMVLFAILATLVLRSGLGDRRRAAVYIGLMTAATASHLYAVLLLPLHLAYVAGARPRDLRGTLPAVLAAGALGLLCNALVLLNAFQMLVGKQPRQFRLDFPKALVMDLVGGPFPVAVMFGLTAVLLGAFVLRRRRWFLYPIAALAALVSVLWLLVQPMWLYPRFFLFILPGAMYMVAVALKRWPLLAPLVLLGAAMSALGQAPGYGSEPMSLPAAARIIDASRATGGNPCVLEGDQLEILAYTDKYSIAGRVEDLPGCDLVVIVAWSADPVLEQAAFSGFPKHTVLAGQTTGLLLAR
ncbi:MAG: hypothetical protein QOK05_1145 [Chloroflexota bacterium]|jgi:hypothetical protein|nr:hypothetical protein [Chloroflexota bacterium]